MIKKITIMLVLGLIPLIAQEDFLKGVKAEDLMLDRIEAVPIEIVKEIEDKGYHYWDSYILSYAYSPDSSLIAEERTEKPGGKIIGLWILDPKTNTERRIVEGLVEDFKWSPSSKYLSFIQLEYVENPADDKLPRKPFFNTARLCLYDNQTGEVRNIVFMGGLGIRHFWSPTHDYLAYRSVDDDEKNKYALVIFDAENNKIYTVDKLMRFILWNFSWSPNGDMLAYTKPLKVDRYINEEAPIESEVFIVNYDGTGKKQITNTPESEVFVKWLPEGKKIVTEVVENPAEEGYSPKYKYYLLKKGE